MKRRLLCVFLCLFIWTVHTVHATSMFILSGFTTDQETVIQNGIALANDLLAPQLRPTSLDIRSEELAVNVVAMTHCTVTTTNGTVMQTTVYIGVNTRLYPHFNRAQILHEVIHVAQCLHPEWTDAEVTFAQQHPFGTDAIGSWFFPACSRFGCEYIPHLLEALYDGSGPYYAYVLRYPDAIRFALTHCAQP